MKRREWSLAGWMLFAVLLAGIWGCGSDGRPSDETALEKLDPKGQIVTFWYQHTEEREAALLKLIEKFNRTNPYGIKVIGEHAGTHDQIYEKMLVRIQGGVLPGLVVAYRYQAQHYYQLGGVVDLAPYMDAPRWGLSKSERADYFQAFLDQDRIQGVQVAFLPSRSVEVLYYNADWLEELGYEEPPRDWKTFAEACRRAADHPFSRTVGKGRSFGLVFDADASRLAAMVFSRGGDFITPDGSAYTLDSPQMKASLSLLKGLAEEGVAKRLDNQLDIRHSFAAGQALFVMGSSSGVPLFRGDVKAGADFTWDVAPVPYETDRPVLNVYGASLAVCKSTPEKQLAAWLFIKWFTEPPQQDEWARKSNYFPVRKSTARRIASYFRISYDLLEYGKPEPWVTGYGAVRQMIEEAMIEALGGADVDQVLSRLQAKANETLENR